MKRYRNTMLDTDNKLLQSVQFDEEDYLGGEADFQEETEEERDAVGDGLEEEPDAELGMDLSLEEDEEEFLEPWWRERRIFTVPAGNVRFPCGKTTGFLLPSTRN